MAISWDSFDKVWASTSPLTPYSFSDANYQNGWNFIGSTPPARQMWDFLQKQNDEKMKFLRDNFGTPNIVTQASQMTDVNKVYVYIGSEAGWNNGHWYYWNGSSWADGGVYNATAFVTDTTLSIAGQPADAKATGDALALKSDLAGCTFTGNVSVNADFTVTGETTLDDATVTDLTATNISATDIVASNDATIGGNASVTGDISSANVTTSANGTIGGDLSVAGTSTLADITASADLSVAGDSALTNLTVSGTTALAGTSTVPTPSANDNSTKIATTEYVQGEIKPIETDVTINDKRISNIEKLLQGNLYDYQTDSDSKYVKTVPQGAMPYASLDSVGGKTLVWNQYIPPIDATNWDANSSSVSASFSDGECTLTAVASGNTYYTYAFYVKNAWTDKSMINGHKYYMSYDIMSDYATNFISNTGTPAVNTNSSSSVTWNRQSDIKTASGDKSDLNFRVILYSNVDTSQINVGDVVFKVRNIMFIDLTLMFGSGNEPSTVAEFQQTFPAVWYAYNPGTLLSAGVTEVKSVGKNLLNTQRTVEVSLGFTSNTTQRNLAENQVWKGFAYSGYTNQSHITSYSLGNGTLTYKSTTNGYGIGFPIKVKPNTKYTVQCVKGTASGMYVVQYDVDGYMLNGTLVNNSADSSTYTTTSTTTWLMVGFAAFSGSQDTDITVNDIMVTEAEITTTYSPYQENTYPIPTAIQQLEGYGWSAGSVYNYIDYERKVFVKCVDKIVLDGTQALSVTNWRPQTNSVGWIYPYSITALKRPPTQNDVPNIVADNVEVVPYAGENGIYSGDKTCVSVVASGTTYGICMRVTDTSLTTATAINTYMSAHPLTVYYELATPVETDISAYITDDNLIEVESGGSLTFPNSNGTDYQIPVSSAETYMVDLQEAI